MGGNRRVLIAIIAAVVVAGGVALALASGKPAAGTPTSGTSGPTTAVVTAATAIPQGAEITLADLAITNVPASDVPTGALTKTADAVNSFAMVAIPQGTVIVPSFLSGSGGTATSSNDTVFPGPGKVAVAIQVTKQLDLGYYIQQGQNVDIMIQTDPSSPSSNAIEYGFTNIPVLKTGSLDEQLLANPPASTAPLPGSTPKPSNIVVSPSILVVAMTPAQAEAYEYLVAESPNSIVTFVLANPDLQSPTGGLKNATIVNANNVTQILSSS